MIQGPKILVIAAHPDDETLGCGGFIAKNSEKYEFRTIIISEGVSCRYDNDHIGSIDCKTEIETIGNTTLIPNSVIKEIKKLT